LLTLIELLLLVLLLLAMLVLLLLRAAETDMADFPPRALASRP
jgi:hypothetical protein